MTIAVFSPRRNIVTAITQALPAVVTTSIPHGYFVGDIVRFYIPENYGMQQANLVQVEVVNIPTPTTFETDLDSTNFLPFIVPAMPLQLAQVVPVGEITESLNNPMTVTGVI